jgi:phthalate 4,5-cis-dihydrodiol dehydrogenase
MTTLLKSKTLRLGIIGLGSAGRSLLPSVVKHPNVELVAVANPSPAAREEVGKEFGAQQFADIQSLVARPEVDAVYIATPTEFHTEQVLLAAAAGKHVLVEKPMAIGLEDAQRMIDATDRAGVVLMVGHSHSYDVPYVKMREVIAGGTMGRVRLLNNMYYTDWMYRPRRPEEFDVNLGGSVTYRQGAHQLDVLRLLGGGVVSTVRAKTFDWQPDRPGIGAHTIWLTFADGTFATAIYNGYGGFLTSELCYDTGELGFPQTIEQVGRGRSEFRKRGGGDELGAKRARAAGMYKEEKLPPHQPFFGLLIASCEGGDIRQSPTGLYLYTERGREEIPLPLDKSTRDIMLEELYDAVTGKQVPLHNGRWGMANVEVTAAAIESARTNRDITVKHQVAVPEGR